MEDLMRVLRVDKEHHKKAKEIAEKSNKTLTGFVEEAIDSLYLKLKYSEEELSKFFSRYPKLKIHQSTLEYELKGLPPEVCKKILEIEEKCKENIEFNILKKSPTKEELRKILRDHIEGIHIIVKTGEKNKEKAQEELFKISKIIEEMNDEDKGKNPNAEFKEIDVSISMKIGDRDLDENEYKFLIFSCYHNKKADSNKKEGEKEID